MREPGCKHQTLQSQVLVLEMLKAWGNTGLCRHVEDMQRSYARRASVIVAAADEHLKDVASWRAPQVGFPGYSSLRSPFCTTVLICSLLAAKTAVPH